MNASPLDELLLAPDRLGREGMALAVALSLLPLVALLLLSLARFERARRFAAAARSSVREEVPASPGRAVLAGRAERAEGGSDVLVRLAIVQEGTETKQKGTWVQKEGMVHRWVEVSRKLEVEPFDLVLPGGERVPVRPGHDVALVDDLDDFRRLGGPKRQATATIRHGDRATVAGELVAGGAAPGAGYRDARPRLILVPPARGRMLVSSEPLEKRFHEESRLFRQLAFLAAGALAAHLALYGDVYWLGARGEVRELPVDNLKVESHLSTKGSTTVTRYFLQARVWAKNGGSRLLRGEVGAKARDAHERWGSDMRVPFLVDPAWPSIHAIGRFPDVRRTRALLGVALALVTCFVWGMLRAGGRPWYDKKRVEHRGEGPLG